MVAVVLAAAAAVALTAAPAQAEVPSETEVAALLAGEVRPGQPSVVTYQAKLGDQVETHRVERSVRADVGAQGCWIGSINLRAGDRHEWRHEFHWCEDGSRVLGIHRNEGHNIFTAIGWVFQGNKQWYTRLEGSVGYAYMRAEYHGPNGWVATHPRHEARVKTNGVWESVQSAAQ